MADRPRDAKDRVRVLMIRAGFTDGREHGQWVRREVPLIHALRREGVDVHVGLLPDPSDFATVLANAGIPATPLAVSSPALSRRRLDAILARRQIQTLVRDVRPDIVDAAGPLRALLTSAASDGDPPVVYRRHHERGSRFITAMSRAASRRCAATVVSCASVRESVVAEGRSDGRILIATSGTTAIPRADAAATRALFHERGYPPNTRLVVSIGRLSKEKGFDVLIDAISFLDQSEPTVVAILGRGPESARLARRAAQRGVDVDLAGYRADIDVWLSASSVAVQPSRSEGYCKVVLEAMSLGVPVVASSVGGLRESVRHQATGLQVRPNDARELAEAINSILSDNDFGSRLGATAKAIYADHHTIEAMARSWADAWRSLLCEEAA